ncbi:hypothetical protein PPROV_000393300 [Pycnococcus provasolii]|uniref:Uncharacterized protein n=1 Tax=Pycnococcus provasolii TaxID=41880 RepID=A0A830HHS8_9CHLO|nr:hypothetical protein PPROV_000393300 [Pycnococcus provasolii]
MMATTFTSTTTTTMLLLLLLLVMPASTYAFLIGGNDSPTMENAIAFQVGCENSPELPECQGGSTKADPEEAAAQIAQNENIDDEEGTQEVGEGFGGAAGGVRLTAPESIGEGVLPTAPSRGEESAAAELQQTKQETETFDKCNIHSQCRSGAAWCDLKCCEQLGDNCFGKEPSWMCGDKTQVSAEKPADACEIKTGCDKTKPAAAIWDWGLKKWRCADK